MALQRSDPVLSLLARRRPDLGNAHFGVNVLMEKPADGWLVQGGPSSEESASVDAVSVDPASAEKPQIRAATTVRAGVRLGFSVPKRLLARAVDRNAIRRVAREAWRHAEWNPECRPVAAMVKLQRTDPGWRELSRPALKKVWRAEFDQLFAKLIANLGPGGVRRSGAQRPRRAGSANRHGGNQMARNLTKDVTDGTNKGTNQGASKGTSKGTTRSRKP